MLRNVVLEISSDVVVILKNSTICNKIRIQQFLLAASFSIRSNVVMHFFPLRFLSVSFVLNLGINKKKKNIEDHDIIIYNNRSCGNFKMTNECASFSLCVKIIERFET